MLQTAVPAKRIVGVGVNLTPDVRLYTSIAILTVTSPIVINVPTRGLLAVETKDSFVLWLAKFKYQKTCL